MFGDFGHVLLSLICSMMFTVVPHPVLYTYKCHVQLKLHLQEALCKGLVF